MSSLQHLDLSDNRFYGSIPRRINNLYGLSYLNLSSNIFQGWYLKGIRNLQQLRVLDFHSNELLGDVGVFFLELLHVEYIDLSGNVFSGSLPSNLENISSLGNPLQYLNLSNNRLNDHVRTEHDFLHNSIHGILSTSSVITKSNTVPPLSLTVGTISKSETKGSDGLDRDERELGGSSNCGKG
ncbi:hypothetical protein Ancab_011306 [Ancistrocladus abbreviatus]